MALVVFHLLLALKMRMLDIQQTVAPQGRFNTDCLYFDQHLKLWPKLLYVFFVELKEKSQQFLLRVERVRKVLPF